MVTTGWSHENIHTKFGKTQHAQLMLTKSTWCGERESNPRSRDSKSCAVTTRPPPHIVGVYAKHS